ncbi:GrpB family protein [Bifidobacterium coryneforme]
MSKEELWRLFPIELVEHQDVWEDYYKEEEENLLSTLGDAISRIDHIGSTSVPGLLAKPIVDILLQVRPNTDMRRIVEELESAGWFVMYQDISGGEVDLSKGLYGRRIRRQGLPSAP